MTAPNLRNPNNIIGKTSVTQSVSTTSSPPTPYLSNGASSNKVFKINSIFAANKNGTNSSTISVSIFNGSVDTWIAYTINVPADATQVLSTKETYFYLEENCSIRAFAGTASHIDLIISYEELYN